MNPEAAKRLAAATIECAVLDAQGARQSDRPHAVAWLASSAAIPWFEILDINQQYFLEKSKWCIWAHAVLVDTPECDYRSLIEATLLTVIAPVEPIEA
jgi:hypothetical protein